MTGEKIRIIVTDDHALFRTGVKTSLSRRENMEIIGETENGLQIPQNLILDRNHNISFLSSIINAS